MGETAWALLIICAGLAFAFGFCYMVLMRCCAGPLVWMIILLYFVLVAFFAKFLYDQADRYAQLAIEDAADGKVDENFEQSERLCRYGSYGLCGLFVISLMILACIFNSIRITIAILESASEFVQEVSQSICVPIFGFLFLASFFAYWLIIALYLYTSGTWSQVGQQPFGKIEWDAYIQEILIVHCFALFWNVAFMMAFNQYVIASACCMWYFKKKPVKPVSRSIFRGLCKHLGSLAFGSFILALVWLA